MTSQSDSYDISIEEVEKKETDGLDYSALKLKLKGKQVNENLVNTLRRAMLNNIPTYAFASECIQIEKNTSVYNNDQVRIHLTQLPVLRTIVNLSYLEDKYWLDVNYASADREKHPAEQNIEIYVSATNTDDTIKYVTTNDIQYYENNMKIENKYNKQFPIVLIKLRPREIFKCKLKAVLGTGETNAIWAGAGNVYYNFSDHEALMNIESLGQFDEYELLWKATRFMQAKMRDLKRVIYDKYENNIAKNDALQLVELILDNETHTIGNMLIEFLQDRDDVVFAGFGKQHELVKQITVNIKYKNAIKNPLDPIMESIDKVVSIMEYLEKKIFKLGGKYIKAQSDEVETSEPKTSKKPQKKK